MLNGPGQRRRALCRRRPGGKVTVGGNFLRQVPRAGAQRSHRGPPSFRHERRGEGRGGPLTNLTTFSTPKTYHASHSPITPKIDSGYYHGCSQQGLLLHELGGKPSQMRPFGHQTTR